MFQALHDPTVSKESFAFTMALVGALGAWATVLRMRRDSKPDMYRPEAFHHALFEEEELDEINIDDSIPEPSTKPRSRAFTPVKVSLLCTFLFMVVSGTWFGIHCRIIIQHWDSGELMLLRTNLTGAEKEFRAAVALDPLVRASHRRLGEVLERERNFEAALVEIRYAAYSNKTDAALHVRLGDILQEVDRPELAEAAYRQAIAIQPNTADNYVRLGSALNKLKRTDDAAKEFRYALLLDANNVKAHANLGCVLLAAGESDDGIAHLMRAVELSPEDVAARNTLANGYINVGMYSDAASELRAELAIDPEFAIGYFNLGESLAHMGDFAGALEAYTSYLRKCVNNRDAQVGIPTAKSRIKLLQGLLKAKGSPGGVITTPRIARPSPSGSFIQ